jgi:hypothetical protein
MVDSAGEAMVPYGALINNVAQATDPLNRLPDRGNFQQSIQNRIPGLRSQVPVSQDVLGRPETNERAGLMAGSPAPLTQIKSDPTLKALDEAGVTIPVPSKTASNKAGTYIVNLTVPEQRQLQARMGDLIQQYVGLSMANPRWAQYQPEAQSRELQRQVTLARTQAEEEIFNQAARPGGRAMPGAVARIPIEIKPKIPLPVPGR